MLGLSLILFGRRKWSGLPFILSRRCEGARQLLGLRSRSRRVGFSQARVFLDSICHLRSHGGSDLRRRGGNK